MNDFLSGLRLAVLVDRGVNEIEFHCTRLRLGEAGADVVVVGNTRLEVEGEDHERIVADCTIDQVGACDFDGVFIPGGLAPEKLRQNREVVRFVRETHARGKVCAAICHGQQVLLSAGLLRGKRAVSAWSMVDDLVAAGAIHAEGERAVRDGTTVTARIFPDLAAFFACAWEAFAEAEDRRGPIPARRLAGRVVGILVDGATDSTQTFYTKVRLEEEGAVAVLLGRRTGEAVRLGSPTWEWGERGPAVTVERALEDVGAVVSDDLPYDMALQAVTAAQLDGLVIPGGLGTWLVRGHPGLRKLVRELHAAGKPIGTIERGPKVLLSAGILAKGPLTCGPETRDDLIEAGLDYRDEPVVCQGNLLFCRGTEDMPQWMPRWMELVAGDANAAGRSAPSQAASG